MSGQTRPLLALGTPQVGVRVRQPPRDVPRLSSPGRRRQGERLSPQFRQLVDAFAAQRAQLSGQMFDEVDPELVLVLDLAGSVAAFRNAIDRVEGLSFLTEMLEDRTDPDDDFHLVDRTVGRTDAPVQHSLYLVLSNATAVGNLVSLFDRWRQDPAAEFEHGLGKFKAAFGQLRAIRRWSAADRVRETGLIEYWQEKLAVVGQSVSTVLVEVELWYRAEQGQRTAAQATVEQVMRDAGGRILSRCQISEIAYHALLAELPVQQAQSVLESGVESILLLTTEEVMFVNPSAPMSVGPFSTEPAAPLKVTSVVATREPPRVALLDGLPVQNHEALAGRLTVDDPDGLGADYPVLARGHGTAMASLILHGDLSAGAVPLTRPIYVRPIMRPHEFYSDQEQLLPDQLLPDLLHRAVRRMVVGDGDRPAAAPSVRIVNLSVGSAAGALVRRMSPAGRVLDWLAYTYNLLFVVSAGNHTTPIVIPADTATDARTGGSAAARAVYSQTLLRRILPPGDALNVLTVGATHDDGVDNPSGPVVPDTVWDISRPGAPSFYSAVGPGVDRSVKPDIHHVGGRAFYVRPPGPAPSGPVELSFARTAATGPGLRVAAPGQREQTDATAFTFGTSNATALVTREASRIFDVLEAGADDPADTPFPDAVFHPVLARALLVHASNWGSASELLRQDLGLDTTHARRQLTALLGYGMLDVSRAATAATNRAVLIAGGRISREQRRTYQVPLPPSLRARADWHRVTITLAYMAPTTGQLMRYRGAKVYFSTPDTALLAGTRVEAEHNAVRRGTCQHEVIEGRRAMTFADGGTFPVHIECMDDAHRLPAGQSLRYGLVVSVETSTDVSTTIHDEIRTRLRTSVEDRIRGRVQT